MAYQVINPSEVATGAPIDAALLGKVKNNLDVHQEDVTELDAEQLSQAMTLNETQDSIQDLEGSISGMQSSITGINSTLGTAVGNISTLTTNVGTNSSNITTLQGQVSTLNADKAAYTPAALLSSGNQIAISFLTKLNFEHTLTENTTLANPTNVTVGQSGQIYITQNATTARTLAFASNWKSTDGLTPTVSTTLNAKNLITYYVASSTEIWFVLLKRGIA